MHEFDQTPCPRSQLLDGPALISDRPSRESRYESLDSWQPHVIDGRGVWQLSARFSVTARPGLS